MAENQMVTVTQAPPPVLSNFATLAGFELLQRMAMILCKSSIFPDQFSYFAKDGKLKDDEGKALALANSVIALEISQRIAVSPLMVAQNLVIIYGRPSWSSTFVIAVINACGRFSPLRFSITREEQARDIAYTYTEGWGQQKQTKTGKLTVQNVTCVASAQDLKSGDILVGPVVSIEMAIKEGWYTKTGSKWTTMPELMLRYRAAAFFGRLFAPDLLMGMRSVEEVIDIQGDVTDADEMTGGSKREVLNKEIKAGSKKQQTAVRPAPSPEGQQESPREGTRATATPPKDDVEREKNAIDKCITSLAVDKWRLNNFDRIQKLGEEKAKLIMDHANFVYQALSIEEDRENDEMFGDDQGDDKLEMEV